MDDLRFYGFFTLFQSYQDEERVIMKGCVQWNSVMVEKIYTLTSRPALNLQSYQASGFPKESELENVFVKHYAPKHMPDPKGEWSLKENNSELHYRNIQKLISSATPWSVTICQISGS